MVQWLRFHALTEGVTSSITGREVPKACTGIVQPKKKENRNREGSIEVYSCQKFSNISFK